MEDTIKWLRPKAKLPKSYEEACDEVEEMEAKMTKYAEELFEEQPNLLAEVQGPVQVGQFRSAHIERPTSAQDGAGGTKRILL